MSALEHNTFLRWLAVFSDPEGPRSGSCRLGPAAYTALRQALPRNQTLETLTLETYDGETEEPEGDGNGRVAAQVFASLVASPAVIEASGGGGGAGGCSALKYLSLQWIDIDAAAAAALGRSLRLGALLEELDLDHAYQRLGDAAVLVDGTAIAAEVGGALTSLGSRARLRILRLGRCSVGAAGARP